MPTPCTCHPGKTCDSRNSCDVARAVEFGKPGAVPEAMSADNLPPLPPMAMTVAEEPGRGHYYTADQMRAYAKAARDAQWLAGGGMAAPDLLPAFDKAVSEELPRVSHVEYDSHEICKHFAGKVRERLAAALSAPAGDVVRGAWRDAACWLRNNYQDHPNIASLCDAMIEAGAKGLR